MKNKKFKKVSFNNHKKQLTVTYISGKQISVHYSQLGIKANILEVWVDHETRGQSVGMRFADGITDFMPYDQPLALGKDSDYLLQTHIELIIARIKEAIRVKKISKKYLAEQLHTSLNQIQRLLNPAIVNKNLSQLYHISSLLGLEVKMALKAA